MKYEPSFYRNQTLSIDVRYDFAKKSLERNPNSLKDLLQFAELELKMNNIESGLSILDKLSKNPQCTPNQIAKIAYLYYYIKEFDLALNLLEGQPNYKGTLDLKCLLALGKNNEALKKSQRFRKLYPNNESNNLIYAKLLLNNSEDQLVESICSDILKLNPTCIEAIEILNKIESKTNGVLNSKYLEFESFVMNFQLDLDGNKDLNKLIKGRLLSNKYWVDNPKQYSTIGGSQLSELFNSISLKDDKFFELQSLFHNRIVEYLNIMKEGDFDYFKPNYSKLLSNTWAVNLSTGGYQKAHLHKTGWVSGVYYLEVPNFENGEGNIQFGLMEDKVFKVYKEVKPINGMLVLFPSFCLHKTVPFHTDGQRICISFDIYPMKNS